MATPVTVTTYYRDDDYFEGKNSPIYVYGGSTGGGTIISPANYYTKTELATDGVLDTRYYTETESDARYYTQTQLDAGQLDTRYYTETESDARYYTQTQLDGGQLDTRYYTETESDARFVHLTGNETIAGVKTFTGTIKAEDLESADVAYTSGFTGNGWTITDTGSNNYLAEFDDMVVRGSMQIYELIVNKIRSTGGTLWVTDYAESLDVVLNDGSNYLLVEPDSNTLDAGDKIRGQRFTGTSVYKYEYTISSISTDRTKIYVTGATVGDFTLDMTFVRVGNSSDTARQGSLFMTSSLVNSPYLEVLDGMTTHTIADANRKARLGNLTGLSFDGSALGGYGLYSDNAYLQGKIVATEGDIGNWNIQGGSLYSDTGTGDITLDADLAQIVIKDATDDIKVYLTKDSIPSWSSSYSGSAKNFTGSAADQYTDVSQSSATGSGDDNTWYLQEYSTSTYLDMFTSDQGVTRHIPIVSENPYAVVLKWDTTLSYTIPPDDTDETDGLTYENTLGGSYDQVITVKAYTSAGTLLATQVNSFLGKTESLADVTLFNKVIQTDDAYVYFTIQVDTDNNLYTNQHRHIWEWTGSEWIEVFSIESQLSLTTTFNMQVEELTMEGNVNQVAIGNNGFMHWSDSDNYFHVNEDEGTYYIHSNGDWRHYKGMTIGSSFSTDPKAGTRIIYSYSASVSGTFSNYALNINTNHSGGYGIAIHNDGNNVDRHGMIIRCGADSLTTADNIAIRFEDGNGGYVGAIYFDSTQLTLYYASDEKLKGEIAEVTDLDALDTLSQIKLKSWKWKRRDDKLGTISEDLVGDPVRGYIADDLEKVYPIAVKTDPETGYKCISHERLIPLLQVAIGQQQQQIEDLQVAIDKLKK